MHLPKTNFGVTKVIALHYATEMINGAYLTELFQNQM